MSVTGKRGAGIPIILLHDAAGGTVTIELKNQCIYRGQLEDVQDNMNCVLKVDILLRNISFIVTAILLHPGLYKN